MRTSRLFSSRLALGFLVLLTSVACGADVSSAELPGERVRRLEAGDSLPSLTRPAGFAGTLPCADCAGIETWLVLHPDGSYRLRERYLEGNATASVRVGRWSLSRDSVPVVALYGTDSVPRRFAMTGALTLRTLARDGSPIESEQPLELVRVSMPSDLQAPARIRGEFRYMADAATLVSCEGGIQFPVAGDSAFIRLQRAHREQNLGTGAAILVDAVGRLQVRAGAEEGTQVETFVVDSFAVVNRREACEATTVTAYIAIGDWQLGALDGVRIGDLAREQQPTLRFVLSEPTMFGHAGCNRWTGRAVLRGLTLAPQPAALTMKMCADSTVMAREKRYAEVMGGGGWWRLEGGELVLSRGGLELARFWRR
ncbi:copper resistance protein NlpE N-terminal domain-containing protein [Pseudogemmatithrix spongiicola]|uniref:Copper resistance protein NlpE N-terminal domain-containing protein n=1 Tax=Pseudogemmatithrix spongiicola TaxID=3062599 RepID=A0AA49JTI6_9BACT|nr:copper resistance protein NlpE N-terminal domain-containing protein [Gemmatimonadaceae bacterium 'strain 138']WKW14569.1 copper resistance protein NlpE N-terminal domain-containing protein [Gemmatimonadaceae bacterium 'strain 318']